MKKHIVVILLSLFLSSLATAGNMIQRASISDPTEIWSAWGGEIEFKLAHRVLADWEIEFIDSAGRTTNSLLMPVANTGSIDFYSPAGNFEGFVDGSLQISSSFTIRRKGNQIALDGLRLTPVERGDYSTFRLEDRNGAAMFYATNMHVYVSPENQQLVIERMDLSIAPELAEKLGLIDLQMVDIAELAVAFNLNVPAGANLSQRGTQTCNVRPNWPTEGHIVDVFLTNIDEVVDRGTVTNATGTFEIITPSSSLENDPSLDAADVPWYEKFTPAIQSDSPYRELDQHPYLIWNLFRISEDGAFEQIGRSGIKHAFLTINTQCTLNCGDSHILWPGCGDVYGSGNNDSDSDLGPRVDVNPRTGIFQSVGSFFDPDSVCDQPDNNCRFSPPNISDGNGENRMLVLRDDLRTPNAEYIFESWYVIRDDSNIFNSMGYKQVTPNNPGGGNGWTYPAGAFVQAAGIDAWVSPDADPSTGSQNTVFFDPSIGHFKLAVKTTDLGNGVFRYVYMLMNFDVDQGVSELNLNASAAGITGFDFHDVDHDAANDWSMDTSDGLSFKAAAGNQMPWGNGYTFSFDGPAPVAGQATVRAGNIDSPRVVNVDILVPGMSEEFLVDGFESND